MSTRLIWLILLLIIPKAISFPSSQQYTYTVTVILLLSRIISPSYSCYAREGLVYIAIETPSS